VSALYATRDEVRELKRKIETLGVEQHEMREDISGTREIASHAARDSEYAHQSLEGLEERIDKKLEPRFTKIESSIDGLRGSVDALRGAILQGRQRDAELERRVGDVRKVAHSAQDLAEEAKKGLALAEAQRKAEAADAWNSHMALMAKQGREQRASLKDQWVRVGVEHGSKELVKWLAGGGLVLVIGWLVTAARGCFGG
jgi:chromosome segregation ATPase